MDFGQAAVGLGQGHALFALQPGVGVIRALARQLMEGLGLLHAGRLHAAIAAVPVDEREVEGQAPEVVFLAVSGLVLTGG